MNRDTQEKGKRRSRKHGRKRLVICLVAVACAVVAVWLLWAVVQYRNVDSRLAAIEAARAIPDEENAATIYKQIARDYDETVMSLSFPDITIENKTVDDPWRDADYPELARWMKERQGLIVGLLEAGGKKECRFEITGFPEPFSRPIERLGAVRRWAFLLVRAANNDLGETRTDSAIKKYVTVIRMADHFNQQPVMVDNMVGIAIEAFALKRLKSLIVERPCSQAQLEAIEQGLPTIENDWEDRSKKMLAVERLYRRKESKLLNWLMYMWRDIEDSAEFKRMHEQYLRLLSYRQGMRILIALRRHKDKNGRWPDSLNELRDTAPQELLVDPQNGGAYVYRLTADGFILYSRGINNIDEEGERTSGGADDYQIWTSRGQ
jgi:hypothetical protein